ncbi:hypothetical protein Pmani_011257 [Petrolisthes manimaculis]|uniref:Synaptonemal complex protein 2 Spt16M-like domain-containing protein n=1 Tax=Petrolisthes manimaculis TaxID=1843537 RepID=A0AAE1PZZ6_9EUCA|nr:hypothetical protein Pmani_011257 [Petrolisthes manimaculis]
MTQPSLKWLLNSCTTSEELCETLRVDKFLRSDSTLHLPPWSPGATHAVQRWTHTIVKHGYINCAFSLWQILAYYGRSSEKVDAETLIDVYLTIGEFLKKSIHHMADTAPPHTWWSAISELFYSLLENHAGALRKRMVDVGKSLLLSIVDASLPHVVRRSAVGDFNELLKLSQSAAHGVLKRELSSLFLKLPGLLKEIGDYDTQTSVIEAIYRMTSGSERSASVSQWFPDLDCTLKSQFIMISEFDPDCRRFLNAFNESLGSRRKVYTFPCEAAHVGKLKLTKPKSPAYQKFWVDFSVDSKTILILCQKFPTVAQSPNDPPWESLIINERDTQRVTLNRTIHMYTLEVEVNSESLVIDLFVSPLSPESQGLISKTFELEFMPNEALQTVCTHLYGDRFQVVALEPDGWTNSVPRTADHVKSSSSGRTRQKCSENVQKVKTGSSSSSSCWKLSSSSKKRKVNCGDIDEQTLASSEAVQPLRKKYHKSSIIRSSDNYSSHHQDTTDPYQDQIQGSQNTVSTISSSQVRPLRRKTSVSSMVLMADSDEMVSPYKERSTGKGVGQRKAEENTNKKVCSEAEANFSSQDILSMAMDCFEMQQSVGMDKTSPAVLQKAQSHKQTKPSQVQNNHLPLQTTPRQKSEPSPQVQKTPTQLQKTPTQVQETPTQVQETPTQVMKPSTHVQKTPTMEQKDASHVKKIPFNVKETPTPPPMQKEEPPNPTRKTFVESSETPCWDDEIIPSSLNMDDSHRKFSLCPTTSATGKSLASETGINESSAHKEVEIPADNMVNDSQKGVNVLVSQGSRMNKNNENKRTRTELNTVLTETSCDTEKDYKKRSRKNENILGTAASPQYRQQDDSKQNGADNDLKQNVDTYDLEHVKRTRSGKKITMTQEHRSRHKSRRESTQIEQRVTRSRNGTESKKISSKTENIRNTKSVINTSRELKKTRKTYLKKSMIKNDQDSSCKSIPSPKVKPALEFTSPTPGASINRAVSHQYEEMRLSTEGLDTPGKDEHSRAKKRKQSNFPASVTQETHGQDGYSTSDIGQQSTSPSLKMLPDSYHSDSLAAHEKTIRSEKCSSPSFSQAEETESTLKVCQQNVSKDYSSIQINDAAEEGNRSKECDSHNSSTEGARDFDSYPDTIPFESPKELDEIQKPIVSVIPDAPTAMLSRPGTPWPHISNNTPMPKNTWHGTHWPPVTAPEQLSPSFLPDASGKEISTSVQDLPNSPMHVQHLLEHTYDQDSLRITPVSNNLMKDSESMKGDRECEQVSDKYIDLPAPSSPQTEKVDKMISLSTEFVHLNTIRSEHEGKVPQTVGVSECISLDAHETETGRELAKNRPIVREGKEGKGGLQEPLTVHGEAKKSPGKAMTTALEILANYPVKPQGIKTPKESASKNAWRHDLFLFESPPMKERKRGQKAKRPKSYPQYSLNKNETHSSTLLHKSFQEKGMSKRKLFNTTSSSILEVSPPQEDYIINQLIEERKTQIPSSPYSDVNNNQSTVLNTSTVSKNYQSRKEILAAWGTENRHQHKQTEEQKISHFSGSFSPLIKHDIIDKPNRYERKTHKKSGSWFSGWEKSSTIQQSDSHLTSTPISQRPRMQKQKENYKENIMSGKSEVKNSSHSVYSDLSADSSESAVTWLFGKKKSLNFSGRFYLNKTKKKKKRRSCTVSSDESWKPYKKKGKRKGKSLESLDSDNEMNKRHMTSKKGNLSSQSKSTSDFHDTQDSHSEIAAVVSEHFVDLDLCNENRNSNTTKKLKDNNKIENKGIAKMSQGKEVDSNNIHSSLENETERNCIANTPLENEVENSSRESKRSRLSRQCKGGYKMYNLPDSDTQAEDNADIALLQEAPNQNGNLNPVYDADSDIPEVTLENSKQLDTSPYQNGNLSPIYDMQTSDSDILVGMNKKGKKKDTHPVYSIKKRTSMTEAHNKSTPKNFHHHNSMMEEVLRDTSQNSIDLQTPNFADVNLVSRRKSNVGQLERTKQNLGISFDNSSPKLHSTLEEDASRKNKYIHSKKQTSTFTLNPTNDTSPSIPSPPDNTLASPEPGNMTQAFDITDIFKDQSTTAMLSSSGPLQSTTIEENSTPLAARFSYVSEADNSYIEKEQQQQNSHVGEYLKSPEHLLNNELNFEDSGEEIIREEPFGLVYETPSASLSEEDEASLPDLITLPSKPKETKIKSAKENSEMGPMKSPAALPTDSSLPNTKAKQPPQSSQKKLIHKDFSGVEVCKSRGLNKPEEHVAECKNSSQETLGVSHVGITEEWRRSKDCQQQEDNHSSPTFSLPQSGVVATGSNSVNEEVAAAGVSHSGSGSSSHVELAALLTASQQTPNAAHINLTPTRPNPRTLFCELTDNTVAREKLKNVMKELKYCVLRLAEAIGEVESFL